MSSFLSQSELSLLNLKHIGHNVSISKYVTFYNPHVISIGNNVRIDDFCLISGGLFINIGDNVHISSHCGLWGNRGIHINDFVNISSGTKIFSESDDFKGDSLVGPTVPNEFRVKLYGGIVTLSKHVVVGANSVILPNVHLYEGSAIGANSLVNINCEPWHVYGGSPIKKLSPRSPTPLKLSNSYLNTHNPTKVYKLNELIKKSISYKVAQNIKSTMTGSTFHQHYHILQDLINTIPRDINYLEIGVFDGGSLLFVAQNKRVKHLVGIDPLILPNQKQNLFANIDKLNIHNSKINIIEQLSTNPNVPKILTELCDQHGKFDILFIDGDHTLAGATHDFEQYHQFVRSGGFIIFDDYMDSQHSPEVKTAVDQIVSKINTYDQHFDIIGQVKNITPEPIGSNPSLNNEFIIQKYDKFDINYYLHNNTSIKSIPIIQTPVQFVIVIATYYRQNGSTLNYMKRCLDSINKQKYASWHIYIIGDQYEKLEEFESFKSMVNDPNKVTIHNHNDPERGHIKDKLKLWKVAGATAINYGMELARAAKKIYYVHVDDDDYWEPEHLLVMAYVYNMYPQCLFVNTLSTYPNGIVLPRERGYDVYPNNVLPRMGNVIHSSVSFKIDTIPFNYFTTKDESQITEPTDGIMWNNISHSLRLEQNRYFCAISIPYLTVHHDEEGVSRK